MVHDNVLLSSGSLSSRRASEQGLRRLGSEREDFALLWWSCSVLYSPDTSCILGFKRKKK